MYLEDRRVTDDPYKGELILNKLGTLDRHGVYHFTVPENLKSLKLENCRFVYDVDIDSNFVPDNGFHAKMVKRWLLYLYETRIFDSFDINEYTWFNHFKTKLNKSGVTQCLDMFPGGHYDDRDLDAAELVDEPFSRIEGMSLIENRHQYAARVWKKAESKISFSSDANAGSYEYERLTFRHSLRAPISHGLASQPRVIPSNVRISMEIELNTIGHSQLKVDDYQLCRIPWSEAAEDAIKKPYNASLKRTWMKKEHVDFANCDCDEHADEYELIHEIKDVADITVEDLALAGKSFDDMSEEERKTAGIYAHTVEGTGETAKTVKADSWRKHSVSWRAADYETVTVEDEATGVSLDYIQFYWLNERNPNNFPDISNIMLEHCFVHSGKAERPLTNGKKGVGVIPFLYPRLTSHAFPVNTRSHTFNISTGPLPHMIILTGLPHSRYSAASFDTCLTKTTMIDPDFEIEEFTIFVNHREAFRSPWRKPLDHYLNLLNHNGRSNNRLDIGGGMDFDKFVSENWMVPLVFDDEAGMNGVIDVRITFKKAVTTRWDLLKMVVPVEELRIDTTRRSNIFLLIYLFNFFLAAGIFQKSPYGGKRPTDDYPLWLEMQYKKSKDEYVVSK